jgi:hypothetical protein
MSTPANSKIVQPRKPPAAGMGRPKGAVNKTTAILKDAILIAAREAGGKEGLVGYLKVQAVKNPGPFMSLLAKVLPTQIAGDPEAPIETHTTLTIEFVRPALVEGSDT